MAEKDAVPAVTPPSDLPEAALDADVPATSAPDRPTAEAEPAAVLAEDSSVGRPTLSETAPPLVPDGAADADAAMAADAAATVDPGTAVSASTTSAVSASASSSPPRLLRLAAMLAVAAGLGGVVGATGANLIAWLATPTPAARVASASADPALTVAALTAKLDAASAASKAQIARLSARIDALARAQSEPAARLAQLAVLVERLSKAPQGSADVTGSVPSPAVSPAATPPTPRNRPNIVSGWTIRDAEPGYALLEGRYGVFEVYPGAKLPGLGRVETVRRQDNRWVVITAHGMIVSRN